MHPPSALSTQNSPFNPDRRSPKSVAAVSVSSVPSVGENPCLDCANLVAKSSVFNTFQHGSSPLTARHSPLSYNSVRRVRRGTQGERPLLCSAPARSWPLLLHSFHSLLTLFSLSPLLATLTKTPGGYPPQEVTPLKEFQNEVTPLKEFQNGTAFTRERPANHFARTRPSHLRPHLPQGPSLPPGCLPPR